VSIGPLPGCVESAILARKLGVPGPGAALVIQVENLGLSRFGRDRGRGYVPSAAPVSDSTIWARMLGRTWPVAGPG
jgi:hypothetical protein